LTSNKFTNVNAISVKKCISLDQWPVPLGAFACHLAVPLQFLEVERLLAAVGCSLFGTSACCEGVIVADTRLANG